MTNDTNTYIQKCHDFEIHSNVPTLSPTELRSITNPRPFFQCGIDIMGPFPKAPGRLKFLIVVVDYFTKLVEEESLAVILGKNVEIFVWKMIVCSFGLPHTIINVNKKQFTDNPFKKKWC